MRAIVSDIHGNIEALEAVLADIADAGIEEIYCLGDLVGGGPDPGVCVELAERFRICTLGNVDFDVLTLADDPAPYFESLRWTRRQLPGEELTFLDRRNRSHWIDQQWLLIHALPTDPLNGRLTPDEVEEPELIEKIFATANGPVFVGHSHIPGVFSADGRYASPAELGYRFEIVDPTEPVFINVGSVGYPRDGDTRACYVRWDGRRVEFRRVEYPIHRTLEKIEGIEALFPYAARLREAR